MDRDEVIIELKNLNLELDEIAELENEIERVEKAKDIRLTLTAIPALHEEYVESLRNRKRNYKLYEGTEEWYMDTVDKCQSIIEGREVSYPRPDLGPQSRGPDPDDFLPEDP